MFLKLPDEDSNLAMIFNNLQPKCNTKCNTNCFLSGLFMSFVKKIFGQSSATQLIEPIFPVESFTLLKLNMPGGLAIAICCQFFKEYPIIFARGDSSGAETLKAFDNISVTPSNRNGYPIKLNHFGCV